MSYRPSICIYVGGEIADYGYYRNWDDEDLFYEAVAYAVLFHDCKSREEYLERAYHTQKVAYVIEPEEFENTQENLHFFEENSEFPIIVDLTLKNIYVNYGGIRPEELSVIHTFDESYSYKDYIRREQLRQNHNPEYLTRWDYPEKEIKKDYAALMYEREKLGTHMDFYSLLRNYRIPFNALNYDEILTMYRNESGLRRHCSKWICKRLDAA